MKVLLTAPVFPQRLQQWMDPYVSFGTDLMPDALPDANLPIIHAWDR